MGGDWDGALLVELPYTGLDPAEQVEAITTDLVAAREQLRQARGQLFDGTSPHLTASMPTIAAMRQRADDLRPAAVADADAHQEWIEADRTVEAAERTAAQLGRELHAARTAGQDGRVDELEPLHGLAADRVRYARSEAAARRTDYDTAHHTTPCVSRPVPPVSPRLRTWSSPGSQPPTSTSPPSPSTETRSSSSKVPYCGPKPTPPATTFAPHPRCQTPPPGRWQRQGNRP